jgi:hypothetical protein
MHTTVEIGLLIFGFAVAYGAFKALSNAYQFEVGQESWKNKYRKGLKPIPKGWYGRYHRRYDLSFHERFPLSGTSLVWLTDGFHFWEQMRIWLFEFMLIVFVSNYLRITPSWWWILAVWVSFHIGFTPTIQIVRRKLRKRKL